MTDGIQQKHRLAIIEELSANPRVERIVLFGSRAMGTFTPTSDVDIALFGNDLTLSDLAELSERMAELSIPQRVDILIHHRIESLALLEHIRRHGVEWFARKDAENSEFVPNRRASAMRDEWQRYEWGEIATLEYGKSLRDYRSKSGQCRVYGTNGPIGWHDEPICTHPGVLALSFYVPCSPAPDRNPRTSF